MIFSSGISPCTARKVKAFYFDKRAFLVSVSRVVFVLFRARARERERERDKARNLGVDLFSCLEVGNQLGKLTRERLLTPSLFV